MKTIIVAIVIAVFVTTSYAQDTIAIDSMQSLRQQIANIELKQDAFAKQQASIEYSLTMHHREFSQGFACTIIGTALATSSVFMYQAAKPRWYVNDFTGEWKHSDGTGLKNLSYAIGAAGAILGTVGFVMMIDSDKWFRVKRTTHSTHRTRLQRLNESPWNLNIKPPVITKKPK